MNTKKLIVFLLWAFLPMVIVGLVMHFSGASAVGLPEESSAIDPLAAMKGLLFSAGAMLIPLLAVIFTQLIFKEPVLKNLGIVDARHCICCPGSDASDARSQVDAE